MTKAGMQVLGIVLLGVATAFTGCRTTSEVVYPDPMDDMRMPFEFFSETGLLADWLVCGDFPNPPHAGDELYDHTPPCVGLETDYLKEHGGEAAIRPEVGMEHTRPDGTTAVWTRQAALPFGVDFSKLPGDRPTDNKVAYAYTTIDRAEAGDALLGVGSDDGIRIWLNGKLVHENLVGRRSRMDEDIVPVKFRKGENRILVKVENGGGTWGFQMRVEGLASMRAPAVLNRGPANLIARLPSETNSVCEIDTGVLFSRYALHAETALVEVLAAGGKCLAKQETRRGAALQFDTAKWPRGPYDMRATWTGPGGIRKWHYHPLYVGNWREKAIDVLNACDRVPAKDRSEEALRLRLIKDGIIGKLRGDPREADVPDPRGRRWHEVHAALIEYDELRMGPGASIRPDGFVRWAWIDEVDDSPQYCRGYLPREYDGKKRFPLVVKLHGYSPRNQTYAMWPRSFLRYYRTIAPSHPVIEMMPHGRGNTGYKGIGEKDVMRAVEITRKKLLVDPDRIYLMGASMGGGGTWHVGSLHPDVFAAVLPICGGWDYHTWTEPEDFAGLTPLSRFREEARSSYSHVESLLSTPVFVNHGDADSSVSVKSQRYITRLMQRWGYDIRYWEHPGWGHDRFEKDYDVLATWMLQYELNRNPHEVRVRSHRLSFARAHWLEVQQREHPFEFVEVHACLVNPATLAIESRNALQIKLTPGPALVDRKRPLSITWNGRAIGEKTFEDGAIVIRERDYRPGAGEKDAMVEGPLDDRHSLPFAIVCGTASKDPGMRVVCKLRSETARDEWNARWHAIPRYFLDTEVTDEIMRSYSLHLYGGPEANLVTRKLINKLPLRIDGDAITVDTKTFIAEDSAVGMICPNPMNDQRYVTVFAGTSLRGMYFCNRVDGAFDFCITDARRLDEDNVERGALSIATGTLDHRWKYNPEYAVEGNAELRARAPLLEGPSAVSAKTDADCLYVSELLETGATGTSTAMRRDTNWDFEPIRLGGKVYEKGIGVRMGRNPSTAEYDIAGAGWSRLKATIGIESHNPDRLDETSVYFVVVGDGRELCRSPVIKWDVAPEQIDVDIDGVTTLRLEVHQAVKSGDFGGNVDWADLRLER